MKFTQLTLVLLLISSCSNSEHSPIYEGKEHSQTDFKDTIIHGVTERIFFKTEKDSLDRVTREGYYLGDLAIGVHKFYVDNGKVVKRNYVTWAGDEIELLYKVDSINAVDVKSKGTYLNEAKYYSKDGKLLQNESSYCSIDLDKQKYYVHDSLSATLTFYEPGLEIDWVKLYLNVPNDKSLVRIIEDKGNSITFKRPIDFTDLENSVSGFAIISGPIPHREQDSLMGSRVVKFEKFYQVRQ
ncbi:MAG: hypothetical protein MK105_18135 [Crocinitomicaceae bacterium]|nr:hypothetical protein [Crocinitomicaceae bacterium]